MSGLRAPTALPELPMISGTGNNQQRLAFTLVEVMLVIAILVMVTGIALSGLASLSNHLDQQPPQETFRAALREARLLARESKLRTRLSYHPDTQSLVITDENNQRLSEHNFTHESISLESFNLYPIEADASLYGKISQVAANDPILFLDFMPSGASSHAYVEIITTQEHTRYRIEPFSNTLYEVD